MQNNKLEILPSSIGNLSNVQTLNINNNNLSEVEFDCENMTSLKEISLCNNPLLQVPLTFKCLENLTTMYLNKCKWLLLSDDISLFIHLKALYLDENNLESLPDGIQSLNLSVLSLKKNKFQKFPLQILSIKSIQELYLDYNEIYFIPPEIKNLNNLIYLTLSNNQLRFIPQDIGRIEGLKQIRLENNLLRSIPNTFEKLINLQLLCIKGNFISELPLKFKRTPNLIVDDETLLPNRTIRNVSLNTDTSSYPIPIPKVNNSTKEWYKIW